MRERAQQDIGRCAPWSISPLEPVPLDFPARRVIYLGGLAALYSRASFAMWAKSGQANLASEGHIRRAISEGDHLVEEGARPKVRIVSEPCGHVDPVLVERMRSRRAPHPR